MLARLGNRYQKPAFSGLQVSAALTRLGADNHSRKNPMGPQEHCSQPVIFHYGVCRQVKPDMVKADKQGREISRDMAIGTD